MNRLEVMGLRIRWGQFRGTRGNVSLPASMGIGVGLSILIGVAFYSVKSVAPYIYALHFDRGFIPFVTTGLFGLGLAILSLKALHLRRERAMYNRDYIRGLIAENLPEEERGQFVVPTDDASTYVLPARVAKALDVFRKTGSRADVRASLTDAANLDLDLVHNSYFLVNFLVWLIPILGFLGTVLGISLAVGEFRSIVGGEAGESMMNSMRLHIGNITGGLALAFDATLQALAFAAVLKLAATALQKADDDFLSGVEHFCGDRLIPLLREPTAAPEGPRKVSSDVGSTGPLLSEAVQILGQIQSRMGNTLPGDIGEILRDVSRELRSAKEVVTAASSLNQVLNQLSQTLKPMQEMPGFVKDLNTQVDRLGKLMADIYGKAWPAKP